MAISDLTNTVWVFDDDVSLDDVDNRFSITFNSNNNSYNTMTASHGEDYSSGIFYGNTLVYDTFEWNNSAYKTIEIIGGTDVANATLISWLEGNATQVVSIVDIKLGNSILTGVDTIKLTNANDTTSTVDFVYGTTPSGTVSVKLGESTLTGVNEISVMGTDNVAKSFGYAPSGFSVAITENNTNQANLNYKQYFKVYDGQDETGTLLVNSTGHTAMPQTTFTCTTGYLYVVICSSLGGGYTQMGTQDIIGDITYQSGYDSNYNSYKILTIASDGSLLIWTDYNYD